MVAAALLGSCPASAHVVPAPVAPAPVPEPAPPPAPVPPPEAVDDAAESGAAPPPATEAQGPVQASAPRSETKPLPEPAPTDRPRFLFGVAMGASIDAGASAKPMTSVVPAFAAELGFGDGGLGFDIRLLSNQATGRAADTAPDRLALDLLLALRPWWSSRSDLDLTWGQRVVRALTVTVGAGGERLSVGPSSALRVGLVVGARLELPLTAVRGEPGELRLRLAARRSVGGGVGVGTVKSDDSTEALGGLVVVF
jgi:hypothetical protein